MLWLVGGSVVHKRVQAVDGHLTVKWMGDTAVYYLWIIILSMRERHPPITCHTSISRLRAATHPSYLQEIVQLYRQVAVIYDAVIGHRQQNFQVYVTIFAK